MNRYSKTEFDGSLAALDDILASPGWEPVRTWVTKLSPLGQTRSPYVIRRLCQHLGKTPRELLDWQEGCLRSQDRREQRTLLRQIQGFIDGQEGTRSYKIREYTDYRSFFDYHDLPLARDRSYSPRFTRPMNIGAMTEEDLRAIITEAHVRKDYAMNSMILVQFQSFSGVAELNYINRECGEKVCKQLRENQHPIRIDMMRTRKGNPKPWYTFIGREASDALREYLEKERGWPKGNEPIWRDKKGGIMTDRTYRDKFLSLSRHVRNIPKTTGKRGIRYGKSPHELRDLARSLVHKAHSQQHEFGHEKLSFDAACPELWMGHTIDPLAYNQFWKHDSEGVQKQYLIAEKYLNILTGKEEIEINEDIALKVFQNVPLVLKVLKLIEERNLQAK